MRDCEAARSGQRCSVRNQFIARAASRRTTAILNGNFATQQESQWLGALERADVPCGPINTIAEVGVRVTGEQHLPAALKAVSCALRVLLISIAAAQGPREATMLKRCCAVQAKGRRPLRATHGPVSSADRILRRDHGATVCRE
jgi:hypothetical protein